MTVGAEVMYVSPTRIYRPADGVMTQRDLIAAPQGPPAPNVSWPGPKLMTHRAIYAEAYSYPTEGAPSHLTDAWGLEDDKNQPIKIEDHPMDLGANKFDFMCGGFFKKVVFMLKEKSPKGGFIIQKIDRTYKVSKCVGEGPNRKVTAVPQGKLTGGKKFPYWEAWEFKPGETIPERADSFGFDTWSQPELGCCMKGDILMTGEAIFYEGLKKLPKDFMRENPQTDAGPIFSSVKDPKLKGGAPVLRRKLAVTFNCCDQTPKSLLCEIPAEAAAARKKKRNMTKILAGK